MRTLEQELARYGQANVKEPLPTSTERTAKKTARKPGDPKGRFRLVARFWRHADTAKLPHAVQAAWLYLWFLADGKGICYPSLKRISERLGCSRNYAKQLVADLKRAGFLVVLVPGSSRGGNRANEYQIRIPGGQASGQL